MSFPAAPPAEIAGPYRVLRSFVTSQLRIVLEHRSVRLGVIGVMLVLSSLFALGSSPAGVDSGWMFVIPVAISAIASGLWEGLAVALAASLLCALYATAQLGVLDETLIVSITTARFALYGITAGFLGLFAEAHYAVQSNLRELAATDPLTKVANVTRFYKELGLLEARNERFVVLLVDVDGLKAINDRHGHQVGSASIQAVANALRWAVRSSDCVARYGGDEFVVILTDADRAGAQIVTNRIRGTLRHQLIPGAPGLSVSVSVGTAVFGEDGTTSERLLDVADAAMYADKRLRKQTTPPLDGDRGL